MLVTHYDSSHAKTERYAEKDGSLGAADAGYGLSTILETIRAIKENNVTLNNGIKILITDGEEYGLLGAKEAVKEKEIFKNVNYLINLEARGTKGPAVMFETSPNNSSIVDLYNYSEKPFSYSITPEIYRLLPNGTDFTVFLENNIPGTSPNNSSIVDLYNYSEKPFSYSITPEIYRLLPNGTDFTVFLENNIPGINISVLDGLENYHTPNDKFSYSITPEIYRLLPNGTDFTVFLENNIPGINISVLDGLENYHTPNDKFESLNEKSLQHYGDQVLPIVTEFVSNEKYADKDALTSKDDSIFFIIGSVFVKYSNMINYGLLLAILISIIFLFKKFKIKSILTTVKYSLLSLLFTALVAGLSYGISRLAAVINGRPFKLTYLPLIKFEDVTTLGVIGLSIAGYILLIRKVSNKFKERNENGRPFKLTYLPLIKFEDVTTLGVIGLSIAGYILLIRKVSNKFKERNEVILGNIVFLFILGLILTFVLPGGSYLLVFPAIIIALGTIVVELLKDKLRKVSIVFLFILGLILTFVLPGGSYLLVFPAIIIALGTIVVELLKDKLRKVSYILLIPAALITILYVPTVYLFNCALTFGALCANILLIPAALITILYVPTVYLFNCALTFGALCATMVFAMFGIISVVTCLVQID